MKTPALFIWILGKLLPRAMRDDYAEDVKERLQTPYFLRESAAGAFSAWRVQAIGAFNKVTFVAQIAAIVYCFAASSLPLPLLIVLGAILSALTLRDAYTHPFRGSVLDVPNETPRGESPLYVDFAGDAATAAVFLLASHTLMLQVLPTLAMPSDFLFRGAVICLPLLATLRMILRPSPHSGRSFERSNLSAEQMYRRTQWLNVLWAVAACATIATNADAVAAPLPARGFLVTFVPIATIGLWFRLQQNAFVISRICRLAGAFLSLDDATVSRGTLAVAQRARRRAGLLPARI